MTKAFTLIELLVVIAILALIASIILTALPSAMKNARDGIRKRDLDAIRKALEQYWDIYYHYPPEALCYDLSIGTGPSCTFPDPPLNDWDPNSDLRNLITEGYFADLPKDPLNNSTYYYSYEPDNAGQNGCEVNTCQWTLCCRLEKAGTSYCIYSARNAQTHPRGGP